MILLQRAGENRIEAGDVRSEAERGADQTARACARAARAEGGATGAGADLAAEAADATAGSVLHDTGIYAEGRGPGFGAQHVGVGDVQVVARDGDVEIVLERERDGVVQRQIQLAIVHELVDARGVGQVRSSQVPRRVRRQSDWENATPAWNNSGPGAAVFPACFAGRARRARPGPNLRSSAFRIRLRR